MHDGIPALLFLPHNQDHHTHAIGTKTYIIPNLRADGKGEEAFINCVAVGVQYMLDSRERK